MTNAIAKVSGSLLAAAVMLLLSAGGASAAGDAAAGKTAFMTNCMSCHGETGKGDGPVGKSLDPAPRDFSAGDFKFDSDKDGTPGSDADLLEVIKNGAAAYGGSPLMAPWAHLADKDIQDMIAFIRTLKE